VDDPADRRDAVELDEINKAWQKMKAPK